MQPKILITGATGALGPEVLTQFRLRYPAVELVVFGRREPPPSFRWVEGDLVGNVPADASLNAALRGVTHVIHMAADVRWNLSLDASLAANLDGTRRLLDAARVSADLKRFLFVSTAYGAPPRRAEIPAPPPHLPLPPFPNP